MPATAGRVRMPANNRVHSSAALQTHGIWQSAIGYDPYAPTKNDDGKKSVTQNAASSVDPDAENAYASFQELMNLARITNSNSDEARGACKKCGRVGHLYVHCRNFLSAKDDRMKGGKDDDSIQEVVLERLKGEKVKRGEGSDDDEEEEEDSESSDSEYDSEMERIISLRAKKASGKVNVKSRRRVDREDKDEGDKREKRGRSKKRRNGKREDSDSEDEGRRRKRRKEKRRKRDDSEDESSSDEEEEEQRRRKRKSRKERRRRRSHRHSSDDDSSESSPEDSGDRRHKHKRRSRKTASRSDSDAGSDDPRVGRDKKRSEKKSRKSRHGDED